MPIDPSAAASRPPKIFGIGLSKTGTSSLAQALQRLGYRTKDCMGASRYVRGDLSSIDMETVLAHDALTDTPIPSFYRELDACFPGSRFILTVREREGWLQSCRKQFTERAGAAQSDAHRRLFEDLYGTNVFDAQRFLDGYERFVAGVREHFKDRPGDLLVVDIAAGDGWEKLCPFVGRPIPDMPFPKANVTQIRWIDIEELVALAEAAGDELLRHRPGGAGGAKGLIRRALHVATGLDATAAAAKAASRTIVAGLQKRSPGVPVVVAGEPLPPFGDRKRWNHLWLVDPIDGAEEFAQGGSDFTVNLALVEDGVPIYGVVHAPALGLTYHGRTGKGAFRRLRGGPPVRLDAGVALGDGADDALARAGAVGGAASCALAICAQLEGTASRVVEWADAAEWRVAAGHAVLRASGRLSLAAASGDEPVYNSERMHVDRPRVVATDAALP